MLVTFGVVASRAGVEMLTLTRSDLAVLPTRHLVGGPPSPRDTSQPSQINRVDCSAERSRADAVADRVEVEHDSANVEGSESGGRQALDLLTGEIQGREGPTAKVRRLQVDVRHAGQSATLDLGKDRALTVTLRPGLSSWRSDWTDRGGFSGRVAFEEQNNQ